MSFLEEVFEENDMDLLQDMIHTMLMHHFQFTVTFASGQSETMEREYGIWESGRDEFLERLKALIYRIG
jgi:hypothetical protein